MAGLWRMCCHWRKTRSCHHTDPHVVYVHFFPDTWLPNYYIHDTGFLDEYEAVYTGSPEKPIKIPLEQGFTEKRICRIKSYPRIWLSSFNYHFYFTDNPLISRRGSAYSPVLLSGASTGLDCGDPFCLKKMDNITMVKTDKNSLCQF